MAKRRFTACHAAFCAAEPTRDASAVSNAVSTTGSAWCAKFTAPAICVPAGSPDIPKPPAVGEVVAGCESNHT